MGRMLGVRFKRKKGQVQMTRDGEAISNDIVALAREIYGGGFIPLHRPVFDGTERQDLVECIDSNFVSSVGAQVGEFEEATASFTGHRFAVATVNGTSALHIALKLAGVCCGSDVITQALTFVATCNAIKYCGGNPIFLDVDLDTLGLSPAALHQYLEGNAEVTSGECRNKKTGRKITACLPMHSFGLPCRINEIAEICERWSIELVEDAAESLGSFVGGMHTGKRASMATLSFNGNKIITSGGGGMILTDNEELAQRAKHVTTTSKVPHPYKFDHDEIGFNYRMPNLNAVLGCAQLQQLQSFLIAKREVASLWRNFCDERQVRFMDPLPDCTANYWLNVIILDSEEQREKVLTITNDKGVMTRPSWTLMSELPMFRHCATDDLSNSKWLSKRILNIPSSVP